MVAALEREYGEARVLPLGPQRERLEDEFAEYVATYRPRIGPEVVFVRAGSEDRGEIVVVDEDGRYARLLG